VNKQRIYKYINLLFRIIVGLGTFIYIVYKLRSDFYLNFHKISLNEIDYKLLIFSFLLVIANWSIETIKWKYLIRNILDLPFLKLFRSVITGITIGLITPNRIGEIPARAMLLNNKERLKDLIVVTIIGGYSQMLATLLFGCLALFFSVRLFAYFSTPIFIILPLVIITICLLLIYFYTNELKPVFYKIKYFKKKNLFGEIANQTKGDLLYVLALSVVRYIIFFSQYYIIFKALGIEFENYNQLFLIPIYFLIASFIPTLIISELGVRGSVALFVFASLSNNGVLIVTSSILLWAINVATPALFGVLYLKEFKVLKEN